MNKIEEAIIYATVMHQGKTRKLGNIPYILHPLEVAQIISTMTDDQDVITAGILHDIVEDTDGTLKEIGKDNLDSEQKDTLKRILHEQPRISEKDLNLMTVWIRKLINELYDE